MHCPPAWWTYQTKTMDDPKNDLDPEVLDAAIGDEAEEDEAEADEDIAEDADESE